MNSSDCDHLCFCLGLGTDTNNYRKPKVSAPKDEENAPAGKSAAKRRKRSKALIRLDDLIPKKDVKGGRQLPFGVTDTRQTDNPK